MIFEPPSSFLSFMCTIWGLCFVSWCKTDDGSVLGFNKAFSGQCPEGNEGAEIRELFWPQNRYRRQHEHLPVPRLFFVPFIFLFVWMSWSVNYTWTVLRSSTVIKCLRCVRARAWCRLSWDGVGLRCWPMRLVKLLGIFYKVVSDIKFCISGVFYFQMNFIWTICFLFAPTPSL